MNEKIARTLMATTLVKRSKAKAVAAKATGYQVWCKVAGQPAKAVLAKKAQTAKKTVSGFTEGQIVNVKVRAYKAVDGKKKFGARSAVKKVTA